MSQDVLLINRLLTLKLSLVTLEIICIGGRVFTYSHCSLTNWENKSPGKFINLLLFNNLLTCHCLSTMKRMKEGREGLYLDSLISDYLLAYVSGPRFVNAIFYSLASFVL